MWIYSGEKKLHVNVLFLGEKQISAFKKEIYCDFWNFLSFQMMCSGEAIFISWMDIVWKT